MIHFDKLEGATLNCRYKVEGLISKGVYRVTDAKEFRPLVVKTSKNNLKMAKEIKALLKIKKLPKENNEGIPEVIEYGNVKVKE